MNDRSSFIANATYILNFDTQFFVGHRTGRARLHEWTPNKTSITPFSDANICTAMMTLNPLFTANQWPSILLHLETQANKYGYPFLGYGYDQERIGFLTILKKFKFFKFLSN